MSPFRICAALTLTIALSQWLVLGLKLRLQKNSLQQHLKTSAVTRWCDLILELCSISLMTTLVALPPIWLLGVFQPAPMSALGYGLILAFTGTGAVRFHHPAWPQRLVQDVKALLF